MAKHFELTSPFAIHEAAFVGTTDPSLDPDNFVTANKFWVDTTGGPPYSLKIRNAGNTAWEDVSGSGSSSNVVMGPPGVGEDGEDGEIGVPGASGPAGADGSIAEDGWIAAGETWTFAAADAPTFTFTITGSDQTAKYTPGTRLKLTHSAAVKYFIVTASAFAAGDTTVTVYGGTDYTLAAGAITLPFFSRMKGPAGFSLDPDKWTVSFSDSSQRTQLTPVSGTWYNPGSLGITIPIGIWRVWYWVTSDTSKSSTTTVNFKTTLSTANNSESDTDMSQLVQNITASANQAIYFATNREKNLVLASKTPYFLNIATFVSSADAVEFRGDITPTKIKAISAYL